MPEFIGVQSREEVNILLSGFFCLADSELRMSHIICPLMNRRLTRVRPLYVHIIHAEKEPEVQKLG